MTQTPEQTTTPTAGWEIELDRIYISGELCIEYLGVGVPLKRLKAFIQTQIDKAKAEARAEVVSKIVNLIAMSRTQGKDTVTVVLLEHLVEYQSKDFVSSLRQEGGEE